MRPAVPHTGKSSDQMPEEAPAGQVPDDVPKAEEGAARESAHRRVKKVSSGATEQDHAWESPDRRHAHEGR